MENDKMKRKECIRSHEMEERAKDYEEEQK